MISLMALGPPKQICFINAEYISGVHAHAWLAIVVAPISDQSGGAWVTKKCMFDSSDIYMSGVQANAWLVIVVDPSNDQLGNAWIAKQMYFDKRIHIRFRD